MWPSVSEGDGLAVGLQVTTAQREAFEVNNNKKMILYLLDISLL